MEFEENNKKTLVVKWNEKGNEFEVTPPKPNEKLIFKINLFDNDDITIQFTRNEWIQVSGKPIYTDILHLMGGLIQKHYSELLT